MKLTPHAPAAFRDGLLLIGRVMLGAIFVQNGFDKLRDLAAFEAGLVKMGMPFASVAAPIGATIELVGGLAIVVGAWTWLAALLLVAFTIVGTLLAHRFWDMPLDQQRGQLMHFMKNVSIVGGLLMLAAVGPGRLSVDHRGAVARTD